MRIRTILIGAVAVVLCGWMAAAALIQPGAASEPVVVPLDDTLCRAKLSNWLMRYEELAKPERERYESYRAYMGECVR